MSTGVGVRLSKLFRFLMLRTREKARIGGFMLSIIRCQTPVHHDVYSCMTSVLNSPQHT